MFVNKLSTVYTRGMEVDHSLLWAPVDIVFHASSLCIKVFVHAVSWSTSAAIYQQGGLIALILPYMELVPGRFCMTSVEECIYIERGSLAAFSGFLQQSQGS